MRNKSLRRALATVASAGLAFAGIAAGAAPAHATDPVVTHFKIHLNVPASVTADWNLWWWGTTGAGGPVDNTIGASTQNIGTDAAPVIVTKDWTPNFVGSDAYGSYAEFDINGSITALNNVMRTTESWNGQDAAPAVVDDPATPDVDETAAAKPAIEAADKPFGGDNIFPAGETWWNVGTGKREYPLKNVGSYKVHINMPLKTALAQGWNLYSWGTTEPRTLLANYTVSTTKKVGKKTVTTKTKPYAGKIPSADSDSNYGWPFVGEDKYGAYAIIKTANIYAGSVGFIPRRGDSTGAWKVQSGDFKSDNNNGLVSGLFDNYVSLGSADNYHVVPAFTDRLLGTATFSNGTITVTPVRVAAPSLRGAFPNSIVVTAKKGSTTLTCTISTSALAPAVGDAHWGLPSSCDITGVPTPSLADGDATWDIFVQGTNSGVGKAALGPQRAAKIVVPHANS